MPTPHTSAPRLTTIGLTPFSIHSDQALFRVNSAGKPAPTGCLSQTQNMRSLKT